MRRFFQIAGFPLRLLIGLILLATFGPIFFVLDMLFARSPYALITTVFVPGTIDWIEKG